MSYNEIMKKIYRLHLAAVGLFEYLPDKNFKWIFGKDVMDTIESGLFNILDRDLENNLTLVGFPIEVYDLVDKNVIRLVWEVK